MRWRRAPAKVNLTLRVLGRRARRLSRPRKPRRLRRRLRLAWVLAGRLVRPRRRGAGRAGPVPVDDNLVVRAERALAARVPGLRSGRFRLIKRLPAAAGLGGGSSDAAACLRALAEANGLALDDPRVAAAAAETGSDVPVCLSPCAADDGGARRPPRRAGPPAAAARGARQSAPGDRDKGRVRGAGAGARIGLSAVRAGTAPSSLESLAEGCNDLEPAAQEILPIVADVLDRLRRAPGRPSPGCRARAQPASRFSRSPATRGGRATASPPRVRAGGSRRRR